VSTVDEPGRRAADLAIDLVGRSEDDDGFGTVDANGIEDVERAEGVDHEVHSRTDDGRRNGDLRSEMDHRIIATI
jgi:hypothetical protein